MLPWRWRTWKDVLPADGPEQRGAGLVVEGDDDAGGREVPAVHQQGAPGKKRRGTTKTFADKADVGAGTTGIMVVTSVGRRPGTRGRRTILTVPGKTPGPPRMTAAQFPTTLGECGLVAKLS